MKEFTEKEWQEVCERMNNVNTIEASSKLLSEIRSIYGIYINEMAKNRKSFIATCCEQALNIHYTVANIVCLSDTICQDTLLHLRRELLAFAKDIISTNVEKNVKRTKIVIDKVIESYMDPYNITHYSYNDDYIYEKAMQYEIKKSKSPHATYVQKIEGQQIEKLILPNINKFVKPNQDRVSKLFDGFIDACKHEDIDIFTESIDTFILNSPKIII